MDNSSALCFEQALWYRWGLSILLSRIIRLQHNEASQSNGQGSSDIEALVPWADFVNHSAGCSSHILLDSQRSGSGGGLPIFGRNASSDGGSTAQGCVVLQTDREYLAGQQVFASYGEKPSGELLLSYGFIPRPGTNPHDSVAVDAGVRRVIRADAVRLC